MISQAAPPLCAQRFNSSASAFLSSDEARLYVYNSWTLEIWAADTLTRLTAYDSIVTGPDGTIRLADGQLWANEAKLAPGEDVWRLHIHHPGFDAAVEQTDGRLLVVTYDDELHRPSGILIVDSAAATAELRPRSGLVKRSSWIGRLFGSRAADRDWRRRCGNSSPLIRRADIAA